MKDDQFDYENPWRPNYESQAVAIWVIAAFVAFGAAQLTSMPVGPVLWVSAIAILMASIRLPSAYRLHQLQRNLKGRPLEFTKLTALLTKISRKKNKGQLWLGRGFVWEQKHAQRAYEITKRSMSDVVDNSHKTLKDDHALGYKWIHGLEPKETDLHQSLVHTAGMMLVLGTTGAGKTRLSDLLVSQAIARGESVILIDPKSDQEALANMKRACRDLGREDDFHFFHPDFPTQSCRFDLLQYSRVTEIASRIASLIPSEGGGDPFKAFAWKAVNDIAQGLSICYQRPTLRDLKHYIETGADGIVVKAIEAYTIKCFPQRGSNLVAKAIAEAKKDTLTGQAKSLIIMYKEEVEPEYPSPEIDGLISMFTHDAAHFGKMISNLIPILNMLTANTMNELLSPDYNDQQDHRPILTAKRMIENNKVLYVGLSSLTDAVVASSLGSIILSQIASEAGTRYNMNNTEKKLNIFVDEAGEVINMPLIQLLNKGRGSAMVTTLFMQTISDAEARLGNRALAYQMLGNLNNLISMRVIDSETQKFVVDNLPKTIVKTVIRSQSSSSKGDAPHSHSSSMGERMSEEEADLFPAQLLGTLPNLEYIAKISGGKILKGRFPILVSN
ncbi:conjugative transfer system coupling protein TraD [uncultured Umboniibacter sp.]|uniref:conjugative transfer system coupling protein TraD n=1 Tax=uncultured Umboniibacter sp. TaxID=1798917 RepID=UPI00262A9966|nr:conjugative transfer system coupling protein TraD [uncultured Umboniibacter sp.]